MAYLIGELTLAGLYRLRNTRVSYTFVGFSLVLSVRCFDRTVEHGTSAYLGDGTLVNWESVKFQITQAARRPGHGRTSQRGRRTDLSQVS